MLEENKLKDDEYEHQYYGFSSTHLYADFKQQTSRIIKTALMAIDELMKEKGYNEMKRKQKITELYTAYMEGAKLALKKLKAESEKIFEIPRNVLLNEDQYKAKYSTKDNVLMLKNEVAELEKELIREQVFLAKCKQQKEIVDTKFIPTYDKVNAIIKSLNSVLKARDAMEQNNENKKKLIALHEQCVKYFFGGESECDEGVPLEVEKDFFVNERFDEWR